MADNNTYRSFDGELRVMERSSEFIYDIEIWLLNGKVNRNNWQYTNLAEHRAQFAGTPILCAYVNNGKTIGDGHNFKMERDPMTGEEAPSFLDANAERIVGCLSEKDEDIRIEERDGTEWIVGKGFLWKWYAKELVEKIENDSRNGHSMSISIETLVTECRMEGDVEVELQYKILGTTILGDGVMPAVADARVVALQELTNEFRTLKVRAASYIQRDDVTGENDNDDKPGASSKKPQNKKIKEGEKTLKALSKKQLRDLSAKFEGYTILAGGQDENGVHLGLMSADGSTAAYTMDSLNDSVINPDRIIKVNATISFDTSEEAPLCSDFYSCTEKLTDEIETREARLNAKEAELKEKCDTIAELEQTISTMKENEMKRRVSAAKEKAHATLEKFNMNREEKVNASVLAEIEKKIEAGEFSCSENECGEWTGEAEVEKAVLAECAVKVMELDKASAEAKRNQYVWDGMGKPQSHGADDVASLLESLDIR